MNASAIRMKKEVRGLFWSWCVVMLAGALPLLLRPFDSSLRAMPSLIRGSFPLGFFFGIPLLAALAFGNEFQHRTLSLLLTQPVDRMEIWREKLMVTAAAVVSASLLFWYGSRSVLQQEQGFVWLAGMYVMTATASVPFWTLLARSTIGGLALLSVPQVGAEIIWGITYGFENFPPAETRPALSIAAFGYAVLMLWLGARKLARFQVTGGVAGDDLLTAGPNVMPAALAGWFRYRPTEPVFNLIRKELRLLRPLWLIPLPVVLYMTCLTVFRLFPDFLARGRITEGMFVLIPLMAIPAIGILAGCLSLGEERTSGTHSWHLILPVSARRQWLIKLLVAVFTGFVGAVLLPVLVLFAGGNLSYGGPAWFVDPRFAVEWMIIVPLLTLFSFWCACAVNGTVRATLWVFPVLGAVLLTGRWGDLVGQALAKMTGTLRDFVVSWFQLSPLAFTSVQLPGPAWLWLFVPVLLLAVIQSYRLFRTQPQDSILEMIRCLLPLVLAAFLCSFSVSVGWAATSWQPFSETQEAMEKLHTGGATAQITVEDLAKVSALSPSTRRWLRGSSISVAPDKAHSGYFATIHLAGGLDCRLAVGHYGGRSFNPENPSCAQKRP